MHKSILKLIIILNISFLLLLITSCVPKLEERVKALQEAHNNHDVEKGLKLYADDAKFVMVGRWAVEGKDKLRERFEWDAAVNGSLIFSEYKTNGDTVTCKVKEQNDMFKLLSINTVYHEYATYIFENGFIKEVHVKIAQESSEKIENAFSTFINWAALERIQSLNELKSEGNFSFTKEKADKWLTLLQEFKKINN